MRRFVFFATVFVLIVILGNHLPAHVSPTGLHVLAAEQWATSDCSGDEGNTHNVSLFGRQERVCELRTTKFSAGSHLKVSSMNGGIEVVGEDRSDVAVEARVSAWAGSMADAKDILRKVTIQTSDNSIRDEGPRFHLSNNGYGINYRLHVPRHLSVNLNSMNGGIAIAHLEGVIAFDTTNGGVELNDLAGDVHGQTVNGGLSITLTGDRWNGKGLNAETTNGGVELGVPANYSAHLDASTVNGGFEVNFPITIQGDIKKHLSVDIGHGGATIHAETTNGGISLSHT